MPDQPDNALADPFGRRITYLRLSVTDRCNLRCVYCLPKRARTVVPLEHWLSFAEITRIAGACAALGVRHLRITGGEPLLRPGLAELADRLARLPGIEDLSLSTNALALETQAEALYRAGVRRVNISLDTLRPERFRAISGGGDLSRVLAGIEQAHAVGFAPIRINTVAMRGVNDDELDAMLEYCATRGFTLRLIETMPMGVDGDASAGARYLNLHQVRRRLRQRFTLLPDLLPGGGPARYYRLAGSETRIGFITPLSRHFCATCNRVRLGVDGRLHLCLGNEHSVALRSPLRAGIDDAALTAILRQAIASKPARHRFAAAGGQPLRHMADTGG